MQLTNGIFLASRLKQLYIEGFPDRDDNIALQNDIDCKHRWVNSNKMIFHPEKCNVLPRIVLPFLYLQIE